MSPSRSRGQAFNWPSQDLQDRRRRRRPIGLDLGKDQRPAFASDDPGQFDGLAIRSATKVTEKVLAAADNLKVVGRAGIGVDNVDIQGGDARGVIVMNTPFGNSITTAEHAIAMIFALARQIPAADRSTQAGKWEKSRFMGVEVTGKTLGVIGCGNIGSIVAERGIGPEACGSSPSIPSCRRTRQGELGVEKVELDTNVGPRRLHHPAHAADRQDAAASSMSRTGAGQDQEPGVRITQLRARRPGDRSKPKAGRCDEVRPGRRRSP